MTHDDDADDDEFGDLEDDDGDDDLYPANAECAAIVGGYPTCPACGDSLFIPHHSDDRLVFCDRDSTLIRLPRFHSR